MTFTLGEITFALGEITFTFGEITFLLGIRDFRVFEFFFLLVGDLGGLCEGVFENI